MIVVYILVLFLFLFLIIQEDLRKNDKYIAIINSLLNFLLLFIIIGSATFNNDWFVYELLYDEIKPTYDLFYILSFQLFRSFGLVYLDFYLWNQVLIFLLFLFFITRFTSKYLFFVVLVILIIASPNLSILLRFYTAFAFFLVSIYQFKINQNRSLGFVFLFFATISHFGTIIFVGIFAIFKYFNIERSIKSVLAVGLGLLLVKEILFSLLSSLGIGSFAIYITEEEASSLQGGIMALLPYIPWMIFIYWQHRKVFRKNSAAQNDEKYVFLYKLSLFPFFLVFLSIFTQIIQHRYVEPFSIVWCIFMIYSLRYEDSKQKRFLGVVTIFLLILASLYLKYFLPLLLIGRSEWLLHYIQILNSNAFEIFKFSDLK
jgi:hypothetical protein